MHNVSSPTVLISVVMPVYNSQQYLSEAIESILNQTFSNFEFIIINDGSTDKSEEIILSYTDKRIVYIKNATNLQIVESLNKGLSIAKGKYIARMDADDISLPQRLKKQFLFMEKNPNIAVLGSWYETFGDSHEIFRPLPSDCEIKTKLLFDSPFSHPTVMFRASSLMHFSYTNQYNKAEDYALWISMSPTCTFANLPEVLLMYRYHQNQTMKQYSTFQQNIAKHLRVIMLKQSLEITPFDHEIQLHHSLSTFSPVDLALLEKWVIKLSRANHKQHFVESSCFDTFLGKMVIQQLHIQKLSVKQLVNYLIRSSLKKLILKAFFYYCKSWLKKW